MQFLFKMNMTVLSALSHRQTKFYHVISPVCKRTGGRTNLLPFATKALKFTGYGSWKESRAQGQQILNGVESEQLTKKAIKLAQKKPKQSCWNRMHRSFVSKSQTEFWKSWKQLYSKSQPGLHTVVNGVSSKKEIADSFKEHFIKVSKPNNLQRVEHLEASFTEKYLKATNSHANCSCSSYQMSLQNILDAVFSMKKGKCGDDDSIHAEHFFNAPVSLLCRLQRLLNGKLMHECVPHQFQKGTIVPIVKDNTGDKGDLNNYRGITIAPIISKIFEHALRIIFQPFLSTSSYQLGFKKNSSTSLAIQCLKETINYYTSNGSNVYCSFLDASKAFDRLVHAGLFTKLLEQNVPLIFLNLIKAWYSNLQCRVRWGDTISEWFFIKAGVRQGGVLSPDFYCIYVDELAKILSKMRIGCHLRNTFLSILLYADDMALLSPSLKGLQKLLSATKSYCEEWDILLNAKKSKNMSFGKQGASITRMSDGQGCCCRDFVDLFHVLVSGFVGSLTAPMSVSPIAICHTHS